MITNPIIPIWIMGILCIGITFIIITNKNINKYSIIRRIAIVILMFLINIRLMIPSSNVQVMSNNLNVLFVIDSTISMVSQDYDGSNERLKGVKETCKYIIDELNGANFSVISFNNTSQILIPFTKDSNLTTETINSIDVMRKLYSKGSTLNVAKKDTISSLEKAKKNNGSKSIIFFISDGEITNTDSLESFSEAKKYIDNGAVLGFGTEKGGYMQITNKYTNVTEYIEDQTSKEFPHPKAISKIDEQNLRKISEDMEIDYINVTKTSKVDYKLKEIKKKILDNSEEKTKTSYTDIYYIFAIPMVILFSYEFITYKRRMFI